MRCAACQRWCAQLVIVVSVPAGGELLVADGGPVHPGTLQDLRYVVTFDGSVRTVRGHRIGGAGAVLWGPMSPTGRARLAHAMAALPAVDDIRVAEAWGARLALLLLRVRLPLRMAHVVGDNLPMVRYGALAARSNHDQVHGILDPVLAQAAAEAWRLRWSAVHRDANRAADQLAVEGALRAARPHRARPPAR